MNKPFGNQAKLASFPFQDLEETIYQEGGIEIEIEKGILRVGVDDKGKLDEANQVARLLVAAYNARQGTRIAFNFDHRWSTNELGSRIQDVSVSDTANAADRGILQVRTHQVDIKGRSFIINQKMIDSASFSNDEEVLKKALANNALKEALLFYSDEVAPNDRPLYGAYKAIEAITKQLKRDTGNDVRNELARLVGKTKDYVNDLMETAQTMRHSSGSAPGTPQAKLSDEECQIRARILIRAYADSLPA